MARVAGTFDETGGGPALIALPRSFLSTRVVARTLGAIAAATFAGYLAFITDSLRFLRFFAATAAWLGVLAGAIWVLWLHGDPSRILLLR